MMEKNILIADDEEQIHKLLVKMFVGHVYLLFMPFNGKEAVEIANNNPIDLAILDMVMPEMDGFEMLKRIKAIDNTIEALIITRNLQTHKM